MTPAGAVEVNETVKSEERHRLSSVSSQSQDQCLSDVIGLTLISDHIWKTRR